MQKIESNDLNMETLINQGKKEKGNSKVMLAAVGVAILIVVGLVGFYASQPAHEEKKTQHLEGAFVEGMPEFDAMSKKIAIQNDEENTFQSPTALGTITMFTRATVRNMSDKTITALEIKVSILDQFDKVIREKKQLVIPTDKIESIPPNTNVSVNIAVEGFSRNDDRARVKWKVTAVKVEK